MLTLTGAEPISTTHEVRLHGAEEETRTHRNPAAAEGSPADPGTVAGGGSPAAGEGPAGTVPAAGRIGRYLRGATARNVNNDSASKDGREARH